MNVAMMTRVALMAAVTAVAAQITVPIEPVPFTFQVLAVILSGLLLGPRYGALAMAVYLLVGAAVAGQRDADRLRERADLDVDAAVHAEVIDSAAAVLSKHAARVGIVDHHDAAVLFGEGA